MERVQKPQRSHRRFPETSPAQRNSVDAVTSPVAGSGSRPARITSVSRHGIHCNGLHQLWPRIGWARAKQSGRAEVGTPVTNAQIACRLQPAQKKTILNLQ